MSVPLAVALAPDEARARQASGAAFGGLARYAGHMRRCPLLVLVAVPLGVSLGAAAGCASGDEETRPDAGAGDSGWVTPETPGDAAMSVDAGDAFDAGAADAARPDARTCRTNESCGNVLDDDCDGEVDEGCTIPIVLGDRVDGTQYGGEGGSPFGRVCYSGQVARGLHGSAGRLVDSIGLLCTKIWIAIGDSGGTREYKVAVQPTVHGVLVGGSGGSSFELGCPDGEILGGIFGRAGTQVNRIGVECVRPVVHENDDGTLRLELLDGARLGPEGGTGGTSFTYDCGGTRAAVGMRGRAGTYVDKFGVICERLSVGG